MSKLEFDDEGSRLAEAINASPGIVARRQSIIEALGLGPGERVLDVGSGPGHQAVDMAPVVGDAGQVVGVDISESMLDMSRQRCADLENVEFRSGDATALPLESESFDAVMSSMVFEYLPDVPSALSEIHRVLRPGGRVVIHDCDWGATLWHSSDPERMSRILEVWDRHLEDPHLPQTLGARLREAGFDEGEHRIHVQFETSYDPNGFSHYLIEFIVAYCLGQGVSQPELDAWAADLRALGETGAYFYSSNEYVHQGIKPERAR